MHVLAIDQGTSATKAIVVAPDGRVVGEASVPLATRAAGDGGVEQDPEALWASVRDAGIAAVAAAGGVPIGAVGLANQGESVLAWDRTTGAPRSPVVSWQDRRSAALTTALAPHADRLRDLTGLPLDPYFAAPKMAWLRAAGVRDGVVTTTDAWLLHRLTGAWVTDAATASRTLLLDLDRGAWSPEACAVFGVEPEALPTIVPCAGPIGVTTAFGRSAPVTGLVVDQQAALLAESCFAAGDVKCTYGTGAFLLATVGATPRRSHAGLAACVAWRIGDASTYCLDGQAYTVGAAVRWLAEVGLVGDAADLDRLGGAVGSADGVRFVPALAGLAAPFWRPRARGAFVGLGLATTRAHLVRAVVDGIATQVALLARAMAADLGAPLARLRVDGGLTRSRLLLQTQADLAQLPVEVYPSPDATALGVAALARLGAGAAASLADAVGSWRPSAVFEPAMPAADAAACLADWEAVARATMDLG